MVLIISRFCLNGTSNTGYITRKVREKRAFFEIPSWNSNVFGTLFDHFQCMLSLRCEEEEDILHVICVRILQRWQTCFSNTDN